MKKKCNFVERKNKSLFNPEKVALAAFPLKSNYIKNKVKLSNDGGVLKIPFAEPFVKVALDEVEGIDWLE